SAREPAANQGHAPPLLEPQDQRPKQRGILPDPPSPRRSANNFLHSAAPCGRESCSLPLCPVGQEHGSVPERKHHQTATLSRPGARVSLWPGHPPNQTFPPFHARSSAQRSKRRPTRKR